MSFCNVLCGGIDGQPDVFFTPATSSATRGYQWKLKKPRADTRSCTTQLLSTIEDWSEAAERGEPVDAVYCDFAKAFDSVPHGRLLKKLKTFKIGHQLTSWVEDFLSDRYQRVSVNGCKSGWAPVKSGVPQGSVLGPLLFVLFVNDLPEAVSCPVQLFADDTKIYRVVKEASGPQQLQEDLDALVEWSDTWLLPFNEQKCKTMHFGRANPQHTYYMKNTQLEVSEVERDLGVEVDTDLKFRKQSAAAVAKASQILGVIRRSFELIDRTTLPLLFKTLVRPHLEYGNLVWGPFNRADQQQVERVQRRATKLVPDLRDRPYPARLQALGMPSLYHRRRRGDVIAVFQLLHGGYDVDPGKFFRPTVVETTRGHAWKLQKPQAASRIRRNFFSVRVINEWNSLPCDVVASSTVNQFKAQLDVHWKHCNTVIPAEDH